MSRRGEGFDVEQGRNKKYSIASDSEYRPELEEIANDPLVQRAERTAWANSNPNASDPNQRREQGFWILRDKESDTLNVEWANVSSSTNHSMSIRYMPRVSGYDTIAFFHTHPNWDYEGFKYGPSDTDRFTASNITHVPGIVATRNGLYFYGPPLKR